MTKRKVIGVSMNEQEYQEFLETKKLLIDQYATKSPEVVSILENQSDSALIKLMLKLVIEDKKEGEKI